MHPDRVPVGDLHQPLGIARTAVDQRGQPEGRHQHVFSLALVEHVVVDVALDVFRDRVFRPVPVHHGLGVELVLPGRGGEAHHGLALDHDPDVLSVLADHARFLVDLGALELLFAEQGLVLFVGLSLLDLEGPVLGHVLEFGKPLLLRGFRKAFHPFEHVLVVFFYGDLLTGTVGRLEMLSDSHAAVRVDPPAQLDPEFILFPDLPGVRLIGEGHRFAVPSGGFTKHGLPEGHPGPSMSRIGVDVVPFRGQPHGQHQVGEEGGLVPGRRQGRVQAEFGLVHEHLHPGEAVRVGPDRVEHP